mmetsp:Transcript_39008/g.62427  ORF Transcript_39008/g.62427 Transcript_39008/m.62427 type:complete len:108 (-) Transcript_39008:42-365(-)|eukprot:CAMPEP_0169104118 /NCGR_PEP_ID=MMETSP1015-20121227/23084_1 /TAXON_ID=342587 /ORGANISM="Karlodinium micrum, Strain CCMP2283" /LENGTH=107 /DNA_ID=CAMNT_0009165373 /DNA_START=61 /DNA_END=384 /DNA_ORIENTATION=+
MGGSVEKCCASEREQVPDKSTRARVSFDLSDDLSTSETEALGYQDDDMIMMTLAEKMEVLKRELDTRGRKSSDSRKRLSREGPTSRKAKVQTEKTIGSEKGLEIHSP